MEVKMNKEIRDYQESMFFGLSLRQFAFSLLAVLVAVGIYFLAHGRLGEEVTGWLCMAGAAPFAACGFFKYHGMTAEQFLWAYIKSEFLYPKKLTFRSENLYYECLKDIIWAGERTKADGTLAAKKQEEKRLRRVEKQKKHRKGRRGRRDAID